MVSVQLYQNHQICYFYLLLKRLKTIQSYYFLHYLVHKMNFHLFQFYLKNLKMILNPKFDIILFLIC